eukprot:scaffold5273_cov56-Isochrysis_galbana.AAC.1
MFSAPLDRVDEAVAVDIARVGEHVHLHGGECGPSATRAEAQIEQGLGTCGGGGEGSGCLGE